MSIYIYIYIYMCVCMCVCVCVTRFGRTDLPEEFKYMTLKFQTISIYLRH